MINKEDIGIRVKEFRELNKYNQAQFAEQLNISQQTMSQIESGRIGISLQLLVQITSKFSVSYDWILFGKGNIYKDAVTKEAEIIKPYEPVSDLGSLEAAEPVAEYKTNTKPANYEAALLYIGFLEGLIERTLKKLITNFKIE